VPHASSIWFPPGITSKTSVFTQHSRPVEAMGFRVKREEHQGCSNHHVIHVNLENSRDHQAPLDLRWPLDRSYIRLLEFGLGGWLSNRDHKNLNWGKPRSLAVVPLHV
jgi:hypothetical protein